MKKNRSQTIIQSDVKTKAIERTSSKQLNKHENQARIKTFSRKPAGGYVTSSKKLIQASVDRTDSNSKISDFQELLEKSKKVRFISCRSQASISSSVFSTSSLNISLDQSFNDKNEIEISANSRFILEQSIIPQIDEQQEGHHQPFTRKTKQSSFLVRRKNNNVSMVETSITSRNERKIDKVSQETKFESSETSEISSRTFRRPSTNIMSKNILQNSKNSSKQSMRKSNSSSSLIKREVQKCSQCELHQREIRSLISKNERLERILKNKDQEISEISKKLQEGEKKNQQLEKKIKTLQKEDFESKCRTLQEQLVICQQQCDKIKDAYMKTTQELKYKTIENTTLKKYQTQTQSTERKVQMLVAERNQLRQRLSKSKAMKRSSVLNYPSSFGKQHKSQKNSRISHSDRNMDSCSLNGLQYEQDEFFEEDIQSANNYRVKALGNGFVKKSAFIKAYDDSSESELISLSEDLEQYNY